MRQMQTLTDARVLLPVEGSETPGRGASRQYVVVELEVAMLLSPILLKGMSVQEAFGLAAKFRAMVSAPQTFGYRELGEARDLRKKLALSGGGTGHMEFSPQVAQFALGASRDAADSRPNAIETITAWIILELAKRGQADPVMFLYRCEDGSWGHEFWGVLAMGGDAPTEYHLGQQELDFHALLRGIGSQPAKRVRPRGGFVLMPREIFARD